MCTYYVSMNVYLYVYVSAPLQACVHTCTCMHIMCVYYVTIYVCDINVFMYNVV